MNFVAPGRFFNGDVHITNTRNGSQKKLVNYLSLHIYISFIHFPLNSLFRLDLVNWQ